MAARQERKRKNAATRALKIEEMKKVKKEEGKRAGMLEKEGDIGTNLIKFDEECGVSKESRESHE